MSRSLSLGLALALLTLPSGAATLAQASPTPDGGPSASSALEASPPPGADAVALSFDEPSWSRLDVDRAPAAREDHTWTVAADGSAAYLFGGRDGGKVFDDLWRFDLASDTWQRLRPDGPRPSARFGHNAVWVDGVGLVVFAGQKGADFFNDLWVYDPLEEAWSRLPNGGEVPAARYGSCAIVGPDGRLVISHGFTFRGRFDDTRAYDFESQRWASVAPVGRRPGERCLHDCFTSASGELVLYGGQNNQTAALGDMWLMREAGKWAPQSDPQAGARRLYALTEAELDAWIFGGAGKDGKPLDDLWRVDRETLAFTRVRPAGRTPPARSAGTLITDAARGRLLLFGGMGGRAMSDLWVLTEATVEPDL